MKPILQKGEQELIDIVRNSFLNQYLKDTNITDVSFNGTDLLVQHNEKGRFKPEQQPTATEVQQLATSLADKANKAFNTNKPILDLAFGEVRLNFIGTAASPYGIAMAARTSRPCLAMDDLSDLADEKVANLLELLVKSELGIVICGRTGTGKTELLKSLVGKIDDFKTITLIEDTMDSHLKVLYPQKSILSLRVLVDKDRSESTKVTYQDLVESGLRNNPDYLFISEIRTGDASVHFLEAALTDHAVITTLHASSAFEIPSRMKNLIVKETNMNELYVGQDIVNNMPLGIHLVSEYKEGKGFIRYIKELVEFTDFTSEKGVVGNTIYKISKEYNPEENRYVATPKYGKLSDRTLEKMKEKELYHLIPDVFKGCEVVNDEF
ncbi:CpaF/VirB11 family protein [Bacillus sp. FSL M8-0168]|uniref:CpaF/VirB11 family protein n=1 Tax=Bacillus sp. FSL M8-0168 TaxID=2921614 RepID=UPI0030FD9511